MSSKQTYKVIKPVRLDGVTLVPGDSVELHPRQAAFLLTGGVLEPVTTGPVKTAAKKATAA